MSDFNNTEELYPAMPKGKLVYETKVQPASKPKTEATPKPERRPVPNRTCYATTAFKDWRPGMAIPKCRVCEGLLHPEENHVCSGFVPKYVEHDEAWEERQEARRAEIREARLNGTVF